MENKDGGPAFPHIADPRGERKQGMTLRDYFAAHVASSLVAECQGKDWAFDCANASYILADAMLARRDL